MFKWNNENKCLKHLMNFTVHLKKIKINVQSIYEFCSNGIIEKNVTRLLWISLLVLD